MLAAVLNWKKKCILKILESIYNFEEMDKLTVISGTLFIAADIFAIISLAMPDWIITDVGGKFKFHVNYCRLSAYFSD